MMKTTTAFILAATLFAADNPGGWAAARWGMSPDELRAAIPTATTIEPLKFGKDQIATLGIPELDLGGTPWRVYFLFDSTQKLHRVHLSPATRNTLHEFRRVEMLLYQKYGRPFERGDDAGGRSLIAVWSRPGTTITLRFTETRMPATRPLQFLSLDYERPSPALSKF